MKPVLTDAVSIDIVMVTGENRKDSVAQVSLCNEYGQCVYNHYVKQPIVEDYRYNITGITPNHIRSGKRYRVVHWDVADIIRGRLLVGYGLDYHLRVLGLGHPEWNKRDLKYYFQTEMGSPSLTYLAKQYIDWIIHDPIHDAVEDARAAMHIYKEVEEDWEASSDEDDSSENESSEYESSENESSENEYYSSSVY